MSKFEGRRNSFPQIGAKAGLQRHQLLEVRGGFFGNPVRIQPDPVFGLKQGHFWPKNPFILRPSYVVELDRSSAPLYSIKLHRVALYSQYQTCSSFEGKWGSISRKFSPAQRVSFELKFWHLAKSER